MDTPRSPSRSSYPPSPLRAPVTPSIPESGFLPEPTLDTWLRTGRATRGGGLLTLCDGRRFVIEDAVRVLGRRNGDTDPYGFTGRAEPLREFVRRGASVTADSIRLGPAVYDIEFGVIVLALGDVRA